MTLPETPVMPLLKQEVISPVLSGQSMKSSGEAGIFTDVQGGLQGKLFGNKVKGGLRFDFEWSAGRENFNRSGYETNVSFQEAYSTSDDALFTGYEGDVYMGMATNQELAAAEVSDLE